MAFESGKRTTVSKPISPADTTIYLASVPTVTSGRLYLKNDAQEERISYSGVSWSTVTGCNRNLSKVDDPVTSGTWLTRVAWTVVKLVLMHDQIPNKAWANTRVGNQSITGDLDISGYLEADRIKAIKWSYATTYASTALRDAALGANGVATHPYQGILAGGAFYNYNTDLAMWQIVSTGTAPLAATQTTLGTVELATQTEVNNGTNTWGAGPVVVQPAELKVVTDAILAPLYFWNWQDGDVTINSGTTTLSADMYYNNLTVTSPWVLNPNGYRVFVKWTFAGTGTVNRNGNAGSNWAVWVYNSNWWAWWAWWAALNAWSLSADLWWWGWWAWWYFSWNWVAWTAWTAVNPSISNINWVWWWAWQNSWWSNGWAWWAWWTTTRWSLYNTLIAWTTTRYNGASLNLYAYKWTWSAWWWWWWWIDFPTSWGYLNAGWWGWWWWWNGWVIVIACATWNFTWTITAVWWAWWAGWLWSSTGWNWGRWWGGWGWNWWVIFRVYRTLTNDCTKTLTGGSWWAWGTAWTTGNTWETISIVI